MSSTRSTFPELLLGSNDASWGDERERGVLLEGYAYSYTLSTLLLWAIGAVVAWFVPVWVTVVLWFALVIPAVEWQRFCKVRHVDAQVLVYARASRLRVISAGIYTGACSLTMVLAATLALGFDNQSTTIVGAIVGGVVGGTLVLALSRLRAVQQDKRNAEDEQDD